jgi:hypothetical protein
MGNIRHVAPKNGTCLIARAPQCAAIKLAVITLLLIGFQVPALMAQTGGGATLVGTVKDSAGALVARRQGEGCQH